MSSGCRAVEECLTYVPFPPKVAKRIRARNLLERTFEESRCRKKITPGSLEGEPVWPQSSAARLRRPGSGPVSLPEKVSYTLSFFHGV